MMNRYSKIMIVLILAVILTAALVTTINQDSPTEYGSAPGEQFSLEAGADVTVTGQESGAAGTGVNTTDAFMAADLPLGTGGQLVFNANTPGTDTQVIFDLEGPWNFVYGAKQATLTVSMQPAGSGYSADDFPGAQVAARSSWSTSTGLVEYNYQSKDDSYWTAYGRSYEDGRIVTFNDPSRAMIFPMSVGDSWTDSYTEVVDGHATDITAENRVLSKNLLTVPAGSFDAFLLQTKVTARPASRQPVTTLDYTWFVPGIGRAAEIISLPDEKNEVFSTASAFYRLESSR